MASGGMLMSGLPAPGNLRSNDTDSNIRALIEKASRMGLTEDIRDMVDDVNTLKAILYKKSYEMDMLELIVMHSDDDNIIELREQLFATVKLVHSDILQALMAERDRHQGLSGVGSLGGSR